jgi:hypothetical protein
MRRTDRTARSTSLAATATTLVALAALAAVAPSVNGSPMTRLAPVESPAVRAVVAVVAAAARDLLAGQPTVASLPETPWLELRCDAASIKLDGPVDNEPAEGIILAERLLDLPPPRC